MSMYTTKMKTLLVSVALACIFVEAVSDVVWGRPTYDFPGIYQSPNRKRPYPDSASDSAQPVHLCDWVSEIIEVNEAETIDGEWVSIHNPSGKRFQVVHCVGDDGRRIGQSAGPGQIFRQETVTGRCADGIDPGFESSCNLVLGAEMTEIARPGGTVEKKYIMLGKACVCKVRRKNNGK